MIKCKRKGRETWLYRGCEASQRKTFIKTIGRKRKEEKD